MNNFKNVKFQYPFRDYQQRVIDTLSAKLSDDKLHVVAAPGCGKTILGLEIIRILDKKALILVPTISIREQWISRFLEQFVCEKDREEWKNKISTDLDTPGVLTCVTYQALFMDYKEQDFKILCKGLNQKGVSCICLDEAHHLKKQWWKALTSLQNGLKAPTLIALTATPPYDVTNQEWEKYLGLCGEIDIEIFTPEMVQKNTLCPYQDFIYATVPTGSEIEKIRSKRNDFVNRIQEVLRSKEVYQCLKDSDVLKNPRSCVDLFLAKPRFMQALISYVKYYGFESAAYYEEDYHAVVDAWSKDIKKAARMDTIEKLEGELLTVFLETLLQDMDEFLPIVNTKIEAHQLDVLRSENLKAENPKAENPKAENPKAENPKTENPKTENTITDNLETDHSGIDHSGTEHLGTEHSEIQKIKTENNISYIEKKEDVKQLLKRKKLYKENALCLEEEMEKIELGSMNSLSKQNAIVEISKMESISLGNDLRMVVLLDRVGKDEIEKIGSEESFFELSCVSVFEALRRAEHLNNIADYFGDCSDYVEQMKGNQVGLLCGSLCILPKTAAGADWFKGKSLFPQSDYVVMDVNDSNRKDIVSKVTTILSEGGITKLVGTVALLGEGWDAPCVNTLVIASTSTGFVQTNQMRGRAFRRDMSWERKTSNIWHLMTLYPDYEGENYLRSKEYEQMNKRFSYILGMDYEGKTICTGVSRIKDYQIKFSSDVISKEAIDSYNQTLLRYASNREQIYKQWKENDCLSGDFSRVREVIFTSLKPRFHWLHPSSDFSKKEYGMLAGAVFAECLERKLIGNQCKWEIVSGMDKKKMGIAINGALDRERRLFFNYFEQMIGEIQNPRYIFEVRSFLKKRYIPCPEFCKNKEEAELFLRRLGYPSKKVIYCKSPQGKQFLWKIRMKQLALTKGEREIVKEIAL